MRQPVSGHYAKEGEIFYRIKRNGETYKDFNNKNKALKHQTKLGKSFGEKTPRTIRGYKIRKKRGKSLKSRRRGT